MPILSAFVVGLLFRGVTSGSSIVGVLWGVSLYALYTFALEPVGLVKMHYIDFMVVTLASSVLVSLAASWVRTGRRPEWSGFSVMRGAGPLEGTE
jgi:SSS family solute:Na+ symporter